MSIKLDKNEMLRALGLTVPAYEKAYRGVVFRMNHFLPTGILNKEQTGSGSVTFNDQYVSLNTGNTLNSKVRTYKDIWAYWMKDTKKTWDVPRYARFEINTQDNKSGFCHFCQGKILSLDSAVNTNKHIGFVIDNAVELYGSIGDGNQELRTALIETLPSVFAGDRLLELVYDGMGTCRYYVDKAYKGFLTLLTLTGDDDDSRLCDLASKITVVNQFNWFTVNDILVVIENEGL